MGLYPLRTRENNNKPKFQGPQTFFRGFEGLGTEKRAFFGETDFQLASFSRASVVTTAIRWSNAGSRVVVSEGEPIEELVALGWSCKEITKTRKGQKRTNTRSVEEWITWNCR